MGASELLLGGGAQRIAVCIADNAPTLVDERLAKAKPARSLEELLTPIVNCVDQMVVLFVIFLFRIQFCTFSLQLSEFQNLFTKEQTPDKVEDTEHEKPFQHGDLLCIFGG